MLRKMHQITKDRKVATAVEQLAELKESAQSHRKTFRTSMTTWTRGSTGVAVRTTILH